MLTANGAALLRQARDQILAHPETFDWGEWDCGTHACIAGWVARCAGIPARQHSTVTANALGFKTSTPLACLFYGFAAGAEALRDVKYAAEKINAFLWSYGFPPDEVCDSPESLDAVDPHAADPGTLTPRVTSSASSFSTEGA